jgi:hypothetical protein
MADMTVLCQNFYILEAHCRTLSISAIDSRRAAHGQTAVACSRQTDAVRSLTGDPTLYWGTETRSRRPAWEAPRVAAGQEEKPTATEVAGSHTRPTDNSRNPAKNDGHLDLHRSQSWVFAPDRAPRNR